MMRQNTAIELPAVIEQKLRRVLGRKLRLRLADALIVPVTVLLISMIAALACQKQSA